MRNLIFTAMLIMAMALPAYAKVVTKTVPYMEGATALEGALVYDDATKARRPGVLVYHTWMGPGAHELKHAKLLARMGYVAFVADIYGKGVRPADSKEASAMAGKYFADRTLMRARARAAYDQLSANTMVDPMRMGGIGFCFGGTALLELARSGADLKGAAVFHGLLDSPTPQDGRNIKAKLLILHGADDPYVSAKNIAAFQDELRAAGVDWQMIYYSGAVHAFTDESAGTDNSKGAAYNPVAYRRSWQAMTEFFREALSKK